MEAKRQNTEKPKLSKRLKVATSIALVGVVLGGCESNTNVAPKTKTTTRTERTTTTTEKPVTKTTRPETVKYPSRQFLGAMALVRKRANEPSSADKVVVHRLNNGIWVNTPEGKAVDPNSMYAYGFVYNQNTAPFGTKGQTSLVSGHDITPIYAPVRLFSHVHDQTEVTHSLDAKPIPDAPANGIGNLEVGDEFIVYLNKPHNREEVLTYRIDNRYILNQSNNAGIQALANPPKSRKESQLTYYDCWEPYTEDYYEVLNSELISTKTLAGHATFPGTEPPIKNPSEY